jgi:hypothetical protein
MSASKGLCCVGGVCVSCLLCGSAHAFVIVLMIAYWLCSLFVFFVSWFAILVVGCFCFWLFLPWFLFCTWLWLFCVCDSVRDFLFFCFIFDLFYNHFAFSINCAQLKFTIFIFISIPFCLCHCHLTSACQVKPPQLILIEICAHYFVVALVFILAFILCFAFVQPCSCFFVYVRACIYLRIWSVWLHYCIGVVVDVCFKFGLVFVYAWVYTFVSLPLPSYICMSNEAIATDWHVLEPHSNRLEYVRITLWLRLCYCWLCAYYCVVLWLHLRWCFYIGHLFYALLCSCLCFFVYVCACIYLRIWSVWLHYALYWCGCGRMF